MTASTCRPRVTHANTKLFLDPPLSPPSLALDDPDTQPTISDVSLSLLTIVQTILTFWKHGAIL